MEVIRNDTVVHFLHGLFNVCFDNGMISEVWSHGIINPIPKCSTFDPYGSMSYQGITLASAVYKLYVGVLDYRLKFGLTSMAS